MPPIEHLSIEAQASPTYLGLPLSPTSSLTRRRFLRRSSGAVLSLTLLDLVHPFSVQAVPADESCKGYYAGAGQNDNTCGSNVDGKAATDSDEGCNSASSPSAPHDMDNNCSSGTGTGVIADNDGSCGQQVEGGTDVDESCNQATSQSGTQEADEVCDNGYSLGTVDQDDGCKSSSKDDACSSINGEGVPDPDNHCGWGNPPDPDNSCSGLEQDNTFNPGAGGR